jgi:two-component system, cell cycle sensor histidine kinase and response regulator CckA
MVRRSLLPTALRALPLRVYFAVLFVLVVLGAIAGAFYVDREASRDARSAATRDVLFSATTAAKQLGDHVALLKATPAGLAANHQIAQVFNNPTGCTLSFQGIGGPDGGHLDIIRPDGTVACSSRPLTAEATGTGYSKSSWLERALSEPLFLAPAVDDVGGGSVLIATAPIPGRKGFVAAFADLPATVMALSKLYGGARPTVFLITNAGDTQVISRSIRPEKWSGAHLAAGRVDPRPGSEWRDLDSVPRLFAQAPVAKTGWSLYVGEESSSVLASVDRLRTRQLRLIAIGLALLLLGGAFVYRRVVSPIRRLSSTVRSTTSLEAPAPVPVSGPAEVRALAEDVNVLVASAHAELLERRRAEESYRLLFESNPNPMWVFDAATHRFLAVNDAAIAAYGYSRDEFLGMVIEDIRSPEEIDRLHSLLAEPERAAGLRKVGIWRHKRKDGTVLDAEVSSHDHRFEGRAARVVMSLDVTERIQAERALLRSEARYRDLFENASDLISTADLDGRMTAFNEAFVHALGYSRPELFGMHLDRLLSPESRDQVLSAREQKLAGAGATLYESELLAKDGRRIQVEIASRLILEDGVPVGTEAICRDISERKQLEEQLRQAQRLEAIGRLAGGVAHDFNNLLTVISGYAETLLEGRDRSTEFELDQIAAAAERAAILTRQLLAFSRRQVLQPRVIELNEVVEGLAPMLTRLIGEDIELVSLLDPGAAPVLADPNQLEQVIVNLAVNARDAMPNGGLLKIQTANVELDKEYVAHHGEALPGPHVLLSVSDTGTGMDADTLAHVFEPFFTTKPVGVGTGLGLATVYGIVKQSGGSIWVYSEPGAGTTFKIYLPRTESAVAAAAVSPQVSPAVTGSETILLAEDEAALRTLTARMLERHGYEVVAAESATEALRIVEENGRSFDLLLTDLIMPELSGGALAKQVSALVPGIRVLYMSGYSDEVVTRNGSLAPGAPFLEKPFSANVLAAKVRETLDSAA